MSDAEKIARSLSPAQRKALLWLSERWQNPLRAEDLDDDAYDALETLDVAKLAYWAECTYSISLSPLGLQVRAALRLAADEGGRS